MCVVQVRYVALEEDFLVTAGEGGQRHDQPEGGGRGGVGGVALGLEVLFVLCPSVVLFVLV